VQRILIYRPDNIGDIVLFSGALKHIRRKYPDARITLAVQEHIVNLVELCPYIDKCISLQDLNFWYWLKNKHIPYTTYLKKIVRRLDRIRNELARPYDLVIYPSKSPMADHLEMVYDLGVKKTYGIAGCMVNAPQGGYAAEIEPKGLFSDYLDVSKEDPWRHEFFTTLDFLKFHGCNISHINDIKPELWVSPTDKNLLENVRTVGWKIIGLFPGGSFSEKYWKPHNYEALAKLLCNKLIYAIFGGLEDASIAQQVEISLKKGCPDIKVINLVGKTTLRMLSKTVSACDLFISMDTSGLHIAIAAGTPTIAIVGGWHYGRFVPWGEPERHLFLTKKMECFNCNSICRKERIECIQGVKPLDVAVCANKLLNDQLIDNDTKRERYKDRTSIGL
jgi:ADP-heptose:LPS heptosyltransferase